MAESFRDLIVWQKATVLVTDIYRVTESFPQREIYGLTNQVRRAGVSVPSNIAEGNLKAQEVGRIINGLIAKIRRPASES